MDAVQWPSIALASMGQTDVRRAYADQLFAPPTNCPFRHSCFARLRACGDHCIHGPPAVLYRPDRTLENLYIEPLANLVRANDGYVYKVSSV